MANTLESITALCAKRDISRSNRKLERVNQQLTTGSKLFDATNSPSDAAIVANMTSKIRSLKGASQNVLEASTMIQLGIGGLQSIQDTLIKLNEIAVEAANGITNTQDLSLYDGEFQQLLSQIDYSSKVPWADMRILDGGPGDASFIDPVQTGVATTSGFAMGCVDLNSVQVRFDGANYVATLSISGQSFRGIATPNIGSNLGSVTLTSTLDPFSQVTIPSVDFAQNAPSDTVVNAINKSVGFGTGQYTTFYPQSAMSSSLVEDIIPKIEPTPSLSPGYYYLSYGTDGSKGVFKFQGKDTFTTTPFSIADLTFNTGQSELTFNGPITLADGTVITLQNFDLTENSTLTGAIVYIEQGSSRNVTVQSGSRYSDTIDLKMNTVSVLSLGLNGQSVETSDAAQFALPVIKTAIDTVAKEVASLGALKIRLETIYDNVLGEHDDQIIAKSAKEDADIPEDVIESQKLVALVNVSSNALTSSLERLFKLSELVERVQRM
ncbi:MAG: hypothetical protein HEEMFOPI_00434 [Holosporales bacterium]